MKKNVIKEGHFYPKNRNAVIPEGQGLDLAKEFRKEAKEHKVPYIQPCCPDTCPDEVPVRVNTAGADVVLEHWDCTTEDWIPTALTAGEVETGTFNTVLTDRLTSNTDPVILVTAPLVNSYPDPVAVNVTAAVTAAELAGGRITSTSAAAVTATLPTATLLAPVLGATTGSRFQFIIDNSGGANTVTVDLTGTGITTGTAPITGGDTLTVSVANAVGLFELFFTSATAAIIRRIA